MNRTLLSAILSVGLLSFGCNSDSLVPLEAASLAELGYVRVEARFCTTPPDPARQKIKYLFILDHSQSNQPRIPDPLTPEDASSTDSEGRRRYGPLVQFIRGLAPDPANPISFGIIDFNDTAYQPAGASGFTSDAAAFISAVEKDWVGTGTAAVPAPVDRGFTNYQSALQLAQQMILADAKIEASSTVQPIVKTSYHLVFVSDGVPTVAAGSGTYTQTFSQDILPQINQITGLKADPALGRFISRIEFDTAYYFQAQQVTAAQALLQQMALAGNGQYFQFGAGKNIAYQNFAPPVRNVKHVLSEVWVDNPNAVWWDDGKLLLDSSGGGMPDQLRLPLGGKRDQADSDGNGVRDLVEYRMKGRICNSPDCSMAGRDPYAVCEGLLPLRLSDGSLQFPSTSRSGFNDCEAFLLGSDLNTFSTNGTSVPDFLAFRNSLSFLPGTDATQYSPFGDGLTQYEKLKKGLPLSVARSAVSDFEPRNTTITHEESSTPDLDCYQLTVNPVAVLGRDNLIRVSIIENPAVLDSKPVLRSAERRGNPHGSTVRFSPEDFR